MPEQKYPLAALLKLRQQIRQQCEQAYARDLGALRLAEQRAEAEEKQLEQVRARQNKHREFNTVGRSFSIKQLKQRDTFDGYLTAQRQQAEARLRAAEAEVKSHVQRLEQARSALALAQRECELVLQHHGNWSEEQRQEAEKRAELELEDIVASRGQL